MQIDGNKLKRLRKEAGLNQTQLADKSGYDVKTIYNAEKSLHLEVATARDIAEVFDLKAGDIMTPEVVDAEASLMKTTMSATNRHAAKASRQVVSGNRAEVLNSMSEAYSSDMWNAGIYDGANYPVAELDYSLLEKIEQGTRSYREDADPVNTIDAFDRINRDAGSSAFRLEHPKNWDYKRGFLEGLLQMKAGAGEISQKMDAQATKSLFEGGAS